jgi:hypothetical protein
MQGLSILWSAMGAAAGLVLVWVGMRRRAWPVIAGSVLSTSLATRSVVLRPEAAADGETLTATWPRTHALPRQGRRMRLTHPPGRPDLARRYDPVMLLLIAGAVLIASSPAPVLIGR